MPFGQNNFRYLGRRSISFSVFLRGSVVLKREKQLLSEDDPLRRIKLSRGFSKLYSGTYSGRAIKKLLN